MSSADGRGRTLFEILTGRNQRDMTPLELQYHNPLEAKVGCTVCFDHEPDITDINFVIEKISVYETKIGRQKFYHTDYHLKGISLDVDNYIRMRLRVIPDEDSVNKLGCRIQLLYLYDQMEYDQGFHEGVLGDPSGIFQVNYDDEGNELPDGSERQYARVGGNTHPYHARLTLLEDKDGNATIEENELEHSSATYWEYARNTDDENGQPFDEFLTIEMDDETGYFTFFRGREIEPFQVTVF